MGSLSDRPLNGLVNWIADQGGVKTCVETGTAHGTSAFFASNLFDRVVTIDRNFEYQEEARRRHAKHFQEGTVRDNIEYILGNSEDTLEDVINDISGSIFFWLDSHSFPGGYGPDFCCPLLKELDIINDSGGDDWIAIDDVHDFSPPLDPATYPTLLQILERGSMFIQQQSTRLWVVAHDTIIFAPPGYRNMKTLEWFRDAVDAPC